MGLLVKAFLIKRDSSVETIYILSVFTNKAIRSHLKISLNSRAAT